MLKEESAYFPYTMDELINFFKIIEAKGYKINEFYHPYKHQPSSLEIIDGIKKWRFQYKENSKYYFKIGEPHKDVSDRKSIFEGQIVIEYSPDLNGEPLKPIYLPNLQQVIIRFNHWLDSIKKDKIRLKEYFRYIEEPNTVIDLSEDKAFTQSELLLLDSHFKRVIHQTKEKINFKQEDERKILLPKFDEFEIELNEILKEAKIKSKSKKDWAENSWQRRIIKWIGRRVADKTFDLLLEALVLPIVASISNNFYFIVVPILNIYEWVGVENTERIIELIKDSLNQFPTIL